MADYPHLNGGDSTRLAADPLGLSQITTPRYTAPAISDWLRTSYKNPTCELGSIEVLVSPSSPINSPTGSVQAEAATKQNIKNAFNMWEKRCSKQADTIAFFYFCGHGLSKTDQFLLPENFGDPSSPNQWDNCINFSGMRVGMRKCAAQTQLFFVDACRETPFGVLTALNVSGDSLITASITDTVSCSAAYYATANGKQAFGPDKDVSYFGQALVSCLGGVAALDSMGKWVVDTYSLGNALGQVMAQFARRYKQPLSCNPDPNGMALIHEAESPKVVVSIECSSQPATDVSEIVLTQSPITIRSAPGQPKPIIEEVSAGDWFIDVLFPGGEFPSVSGMKKTFTPPVYRGVPIP